MTDSRFSTRELYGGAITTDLPTDYIDASNMRQVPDHQEVFLSPKQLTSLIFEINQYVAPGPDGADSDVDAVKLHLSDVVAPPDRLADPNDDHPHHQQLSTPPKPVKLVRDSVKDLPAYIVQGVIISAETDRAKKTATLPENGQQNNHTNIRVLVIRLAKYETDICIRINVPLKELQSAAEQTNELEHATQIIDKIVATLDIKDFGLFGAATG